MKFYYNIHNLVILEIETNRQELIDSYEYYFRNFKTSEAGEPDIRIKDLDKFIFPENCFNISDSFYGFKNGVYNKRENYAIVLENEAMQIYVRENNICINALIEYFLLKKGFTFIHGAGISYKNNGIIFPAPPNTGKTLLVSKLKEMNDVKFFGDDYVISGKDKSMMAYPMDFSIYSYHFPFFKELNHSSEKIKIKRAIYERIIVKLVKDLPIKNFFKKVARFMNYKFLCAGEYVKIPATRLIGEDNFGNVVGLKCAILLNRYNGDDFKIEKIKEEQAGIEILGILQQEWILTMPVYYLLASFGILDFSNFINSIKNTINSALSNLEIYRISIPIKSDNEKRIAKIEEFLKEKIFVNL